MLCSKCHENISRGKEIQIEGSTICKECALVIEKKDKEKVIARCWNCNCFIYKDELIHESLRNDSRNFSKWFSVGSESSEKLFQCDECYQEWRNKIKRRESWPRVRFILLGFCIGYFLGLVLKLFFPEIAKIVDDNPRKFFTLLILLLIIVVILEPFLEISRYEFKKRKKDKKK